MVCNKGFTAIQIRNTCIYICYVLAGWTYYRQRCVDFEIGWTMWTINSPSDWQSDLLLKQQAINITKTGMSIKYLQFEPTELQ